MNLDPIPKALIVSGALIILTGLLWQWGLFESLKLGRLPGDIVIKNEHMSVYFPVVTSLILSALLSAIIWILRR